MGYGIRLEVWGPLALFCRPEMKAERVSYDVMTPSAARGILEAIYWKPELRYRIDRIYVCNPIRFTNIRRNEVASKLSGRNAYAAMRGGPAPYLYAHSKTEIQQRASLLLKDVRYVIEAHFELTGKGGERDSEEKHYAILMRRVKNGQCFHQPCFGCREFPASFRLFESEYVPTADKGEKDLGYMLYDMDYSDRRNISPMFFRAVMRDGVLDIANCEVIR